MVDNQYHFEGKPSHLGTTYEHIVLSTRNREKFTFLRTISARRPCGRELRAETALLKPKGAFVRTPIFVTNFVPFWLIVN